MIQTVEDIKTDRTIEAKLKTSTLFNHIIYLDPSGTEGPMLAPRNLPPPPDTRIYASRYSFTGNRRIAPTQNCTHEIKTVFMMLVLG